MQFFWDQIHVKQIVITVLLNSWLYKLSLVVYVYKGRSCAKEPRGIRLQKQKQYSQAASSTDSSFAKIPPILLNAGIWMLYFSNSIFMLLISSSEKTKKTNSAHK